MKLKYSDLKKMPIKMAGEESEEHKLKDIMVDKSGRLIHLVYEGAVAEAGGGSERSRSADVNNLDVVQSFGAAGGRNMINLPYTDDLPKGEPAHLQYYFIDMNDVEIREEHFLSHGPAQNEDADIAREETGSETLKGAKVETSDGEDLGEITDIYFDLDNKKVSALELGFGFWRSTIGGDHAVLSADQLDTWSHPPLKAKPGAEDHLEKK